jgi:hypothetical protein
VHCRQQHHIEALLHCSFVQLANTFLVESVIATVLLATTRTASYLLTIVHWCCQAWHSTNTVKRTESKVSMLFLYSIKIWMQPTIHVDCQLIATCYEFDEVVHSTRIHMTSHTYFPCRTSFELLRTNKSIVFSRGNSVINTIAFVLFRLTIKFNN